MYDQIRNVYRLYKEWYEDGRYEWTRFRRLRSINNTNKTNLGRSYVVAGSFRRGRRRKVSITLFYLHFITIDIQIYTYLIVKNVKTHKYRRTRYGVDDILYNYITHY